MIKKPAICLNIEDPEQKELYDFITQLPNGKPRNASSFLKTLVDREYQKKKEEYLQEKKRWEEKKTLEASRVKTEKGGIKYVLDAKSNN